MGSSPNHPFYLRVIEKLEKYARNWGLPYLTVMLSTGPLFLSIMWKEYLMSSPPEHLRVAILPEQWYVEHNHSIESHFARYNTAETIIFSSFGGSSWHRADANFIFWVLSYL
jgi:inositol phosphorylceramide mannosyltransferase catalytic subunit